MCIFCSVILPMHYPTCGITTVKSCEQLVMCPKLVQFSRSVMSLCNPMNRSTPGLSVHHQLPESTMSIESVMPSSHLILCRPLLLLPPILPSIRVLPNESTLHMRSKCLLISWLQSPSAVILEPPKKPIQTLFPLFPHLFPMK